MFREICTLISTLTGFGIGTKLQVGHLLQNAPDRYVLVQESGGATTFGHPDMIDFTVQVLCHAGTYMQAREDAYAVFDAIHSTSGWNLPRQDGASGEDYLAATVEALYAPQYLGEDSNKKHLFSTNYIFRMQLGSCEPVSGSI